MRNASVATFSLMSGIASGGRLEEFSGLLWLGIGIMPGVNGSLSSPAKVQATQSACVDVPVLAIGCCQALTNQLEGRTGR